MANLQTLLFPHDGAHTYAVLDGASCEDLLGKLAEFHPESVCLYTGELGPDVREVAPYLVLLPEGHPFAEWLLVEGVGKHWGVFARSPANLQAMRKHFRTFLLVKSPEGRTLYFRYYDPRVLRMYLPTCSAPELRAVFGPVTSYVVEAKAEGAVHLFSAPHGALEGRELPLEARADFARENR